MISEQHKIIFIHIFKTGGQSLDHFFGWNKQKVKNSIVNKNLKYRSSHSCSEYLNLLEDSGFASNFDEDCWNKYFKFAIVRNPYDRVISFYHYLQNKFKFKIGFNEFIKLFHTNQKLLMQKTRISKSHLEDMKKTMCWFLDKDIDKIYRFEDSSTWTEIAKLNSINNEIEHSNKSKHKHYSEYYNEESKKIIELLYKEDLDRFNYSFENKE